VNRKTILWLGIGVAVAVAIYFIAKGKTGSLLGACGDIPAPDSNAFTGTVNRNGANLFLNADGQMQKLPTVLNRGDKVKIYGQANGLYKVDCDGIWVDQKCVTADAEYRNFVGDKLEPTQDFRTGKIF
jgi:hypothetical protein